METSIELATEIPVANGEANVGAAEAGAGEGGSEAAEAGSNGVEAPYQGKVKGIIYPPPDIRAIVDKTARFVAKNGKSFEERIQASEEGKSAKFNFMRPHDPYYAYYEFKIRDFEENGDAPKPAAAPASAVGAQEDGATKDVEVTEEAGGAAKGDKVAPASVVRKAVMAPIAKATKTLNKTTPPRTFEFSVGHPTGLTALDVDLIKLTAQFTAVGGRNFLSELARKEAKNEQFQFLKHTHALFSYFTSLVDAYTKVLQPVAAQRAYVESGRDRQKTLERCVHRWEFDREKQAKKEATLAAADADRVAFRSIDWHDFVVVETIEFPDDELVEPLEGLEGLDIAEDGIELPPPPPPEPEKEIPPPVPNLLPQADDDDDDDMDMDMDMDMDESDQEGDDGDDEAPPPPPGPPPPPQHGEDDPINVVTNYKPGVATGASAALPNMVIDPITGQTVAASDLSDHMRIQLMDPKWREQQARAAEKQKDTALAEGEAIAASLKSLARKRGDIFGSAEDEEKLLLEDSERRKKRKEEVTRVMWDGNIATANAARQAALQKQLNTPRPPVPPQSFGSAIGPSVPVRGGGVPPPLPPGNPPLPPGAPPPPPPPEDDDDVPPPPPPQGMPPPPPR